PEKCIRTLARFAGVPIDASLVKLTLEKSSLAFMLGHKNRFDDRLMREYSEHASGLPKGSDSAKVREGKVGSHKSEMPPAIVARGDPVWAETITPKTGFAPYADFESALRARMVA